MTTWLYDARYFDHEGWHFEHVLAPDTEGAALALISEALPTVPRGLWQLTKICPADALPEGVPPEGTHPFKLPTAATGRIAVVQELLERNRFWKNVDPQLQARVEQHARWHAEDRKKTRELSDEELVAVVNRTLPHVQPPDFMAGSPVYDANLWHTLIPEMLRRLQQRTS